MTWSPGDTIVHHEVWKGRVWAARPLTVVEDTDDRLLLWIPLGTRRKIPTTPPTRVAPPTLDEKIIENLARDDWAYTDHLWDVSSLWILHPGDWHAVWVSWLPNGDHYGWYVNLQMPYRRTPVGIEAMDLMLDVVAEPDLSAWHWKDEAQFDEIARRAIFDEPTASRARAEAHEVIARIEAVDPPFTDPWPLWRPDPAWPRPTLPDDWAEVPA